MIQRRRPAGMGVTLFAASVLAGPTLADPLGDAVLRGLARHPEVRLAEAEVSQAGIEAAMARNGYLPALSASSGPAPAGLGYDLSLTQTLTDWGQTGGQVDQRKAMLAQQQANLDVVRDDAALEIVETWMDLASARARLSVIDEQLARLEDLSGMARTRVEGRYSDASETGRVALAVATAQGQRAVAAGELAEAQDRFELLVGQAPGVIGLPMLPTFLDRVREEGALEAAIASAPLFRKAALGVDVAEGGVREARAARFPRLNLEGSLQRREIGGRMVDDSAIALRLRMETQRGLTALQRPQLAAQRREAALWEAEVVGRELQRVVEALIRSDAALGQRITALQDQAEQADAVRLLYREQFLVGRRDIQDLVIMETEQFEAERQLIELTIERLRLQYRAAAQLGLLTRFMAGDEMQMPAGTP